MISEALHSLDIDDYVFLGGQPANETEFLASFRKVVGKDATDTAILSSDPATFGVTWAQVAPKIAELEAAEPLRLLRVDRNKLLTESDWTGLADSALTPEVSAKWKLYRQRLRNLPSGLNTPAKVKAAKWPTKPV